MNKELARKVVRDTFENKFDKDNFHHFIKNLLNVFEEKTFIYRGNYIPTAYKDYINTLERLGKYKDSEDNEIDILIVNLNKETSLEQARSMQRNFVAWYLNGSRGDILKDAALVAFVSPNEADWRFSLVRMEYAIDNSQNGRVKIKKELTPAKRFSFLVGNNESSHTAQSRLVPIIEDDKNNPTLNQLEEAFNIEKVTKEFFEKYRELFLKVKEELDRQLKNDPLIEKDFADKNISTTDFSKKLLGQIVFLYFLQKKGWFGVKRDDEWGTGPKDFLRKLFDQQITGYDNFFNDILEPLFYEALATERPDNFYSRFNSKIPFLNGGLFDPLNNYDWVHTDIKLPNGLFSNKERTAEGDLGTAILDVFDRYNFTVKEDEPLEKEVAVDPEMLGKVFENLLEIKDRKSKGTYYTPREIVHYMCQESLANYLVAELKGKIEKKDVDTLIKVGEAAVENDKVVTKAGEETATYFYKLPTSVISNAKEIDEALSNIRVCDPAVGSGAFLVGMMTEIVKVRSIISSYLVDGDRSVYALKHHAIQDNLYGVDIDLGATEIAKLRLWLSLIVEETDINLIKPLPNLDYKIMQGNSLLQEYEGIKLFDEEIINTAIYDNSSQINDIKNKINELQREFFNLYSTGGLITDRKLQIETQLKKYNETLKKLSKTVKNKADNTSLFDLVSEAKLKADKLKELQKEFFNISQKKQKDLIKKQIDTLTWDLIEATIKEQKKDVLLKEIEKFRQNNVRPFFLWKLNYSEVFQDKGGFDVIIANPPYVKEYVNKSAFDGLRESPYYQGKMDLWYFFVCMGVDLLKDGTGVLCFIAQNNWVTSFGASKMREKVVNETQIISLVDFNNFKIFEAGIQTMIMLFKKNKTLETYIFDYRKLVGDNICFKDVTSLLSGNINDNTEFLQPTFTRELFRDKNLTFSNTEIEGILNKISSKANFKLDAEKEVAQGIVCPQDYLNKQGKVVLGEPLRVGEGIFTLSDLELKHLNLPKSELSIIKPLYTTEELSKWLGNRSNKKWIIYTDTSFKADKMKDFPNIKKHLDKFKKIITSDNKPYGLHRARNEHFFKGTKIIALRKCAIPTFSYTDFDAYVTATFYIIKTDRIDQKYLLGILNSKLMAFWLRHKEKMQGNNYQIDKEPLINLPIFQADIPDQVEIINTVGKLLTIKEKSDLAGITDYESQINRLIYKLYKLESTDIEIIESEIK